MGKRPGHERRESSDGRLGRAAGLALVGWLACSLATGCAPVRPEQRAILADKIMMFGAGARARAALDHALENREGSSGGGSVEGGGCGCN